MPDEIDVIKGLECIISSGNAGMRDDCANCIYPGSGDCLAPALRDALALLKAQEPRVMTLDECATAYLVWYDWRTQGVRPAKINRVPTKTGTYRVQVFGNIDQWVHADEYGEYWRCWTSRPTDEQREATPWQQD